MNNKTGIVIGPAVSKFGLAGAITCSILGTTLNVIMILVILSRKNVKGQKISPLLFYQAMGYLTLSAGCLPIIAMRLEFSWF